MSDLHAALDTLSPTSFSDLPTKNLKPFLEEAFKHAQLLVDSVPLPDTASSSQDEGSRSRSASSASEMSESSARPSAPASGETEGSQKAWGKPVSVKKAENPLGITVYKMAGNDHKGAWFARRSVHSGLGFAKWKKAMEAEFPETMKVQGAPGEGNIRGIGGERRVEFEEVEGVGRAEVYHLSAQFPGPTTPRDFVTLLITSESALDKGAAGAKDGKIPRHFMVISRPCEHPDCPARDGFIRGQYQSVEFIREIAVSGGKEDDESNPVEWIMITRSDPGGSVPRFMIERGTPGGICGDAKSFLDWACAINEDEVATEVPKNADETNGPTSDAAKDTGSSASKEKQHHDRKQLHDYETNGHMAGVSTGAQSPTASTSAPQDPSSSGLLSYVTGAAGVAGATIAAYTPEVIKTHLPGGAATTPESPATTTTNTTAAPSQSTRRVSVSSVSSSSSSDSFASASEGGLHTHHHRHSQSGDTSSLSTTQSTPLQKIDSSKEKELARLDAKKAKLDSKLADAQQNSSTNPSTLEKAKAKHDKELRKEEEKYRKEVEKLDRKRAKEERKEATKMAKQVEREDKSRLLRELEMSRRELDAARRDRDLYKGQVEALQRENEELSKGRVGGLQGQEYGGGGNVSLPMRVQSNQVGADANVAASSTTVHGGGGGGGGAGEISLSSFLAK